MRGYRCGSGLAAHWRGEETDLRQSPRDRRRWILHRPASPQKTLLFAAMITADSAASARWRIVAVRSGSTRHS